MGNARCSSRRDGDGLSRNTIHDPVVFDERMGAVVRVGGESKEGVEADRQRSRRQGPAPVCGPVLRLEAKVPFPECRRLIALALAERCQSEPVGLDVERGVDGQHLAVLDVRAPVIAAGHEAVAGRRTDRPRGVGIGEPTSLARKSIEIRGLRRLGTVAARTSQPKSSARMTTMLGCVGFASPARATVDTSKQMPATTTVTSDLKCMRDLLRSEGELRCDDLANRVPMHVGEAVVPSPVPIGQFLMVYTQQVQHRGPHVVDGAHAINGVIAKLVSGPVDRAPFAPPPASQTVNPCGL